MVLINAFLLYLVSGLVKGFLVSGFWPAVGGAILISIVSAILNLWISEQGRIEMVTRTQTGRKIRHIN
jgi:putative membrane protein